LSSSGRFGYLYVALSSLLFAISGTASKFLFHQGVTPYQLVQIRTVIASAVLLAWLAAANPSALKISRQSLPRFILLGFVLAATMFTYFYAISKIQVAAAILLQYQSPVLVAAYALAFSGERHSTSTLLAIAGSGLGCYLAVGAYTLDLLSLNKAGIIGGLSAAAFLACYTLLSESALRRYKPWTVLVYASLFRGSLQHHAAALRRADPLLQCHPVVLDPVHQHRRHGDFAGALQQGPAHDSVDPRQHHCHTATDFRRCDRFSFPRRNHEALAACRRRPRRFVHHPAADREREAVAAQPQKRV